MQNVGNYQKRSKGHPATWTPNPLAKRVASSQRKADYGTQSFSFWPQWSSRHNFKDMVGGQN